jgi:hypothetical protein
MSEVALYLVTRQFQQGQWQNLALTVLHVPYWLDSEKAFRVHRLLLSGRPRLVVQIRQLLRQAVPGGT